MSYNLSLPHFFYSVPILPTHDFYKSGQTCVDLFQWLLNNIFQSLDNPSFLDNSFQDPCMQDNMIRCILCFFDSILLPRGSFDRLAFLREDKVLSSLFDLSQVPFLTH